jgi:hypothetical protein
MARSPTRATRRWTASVRDAIASARACGNSCLHDYRWKARSRRSPTSGGSIRVCRPYRPRTKSQVGSGVKYWRRNFLPGRSFRDDTDLAEQLVIWVAEIADVRVHGTTHQRPIDRFGIEQPALLSTVSHPRFRVEAARTRIVPTDYLVAFEANRHSVPITLIGQAVDLRTSDRSKRRARFRPACASQRRQPGATPGPPHSIDMHRAAHGLGG